MVVGILFTFSFSAIFILLRCSSDLWYTKLPISKNVSSNFQIGKYIKKEIIISPLNSKFYKNSIYETIQFEKNFSFKKTHLQLENMGLEKKQTEKIGLGTFQINGNWILLSTEQISTTIYKNDEIYSTSQIKKSNMRLLYYYSSKTKSILPMVSDLGFKIQNYGVKDLIKIPYNENDPLFENSLKTYSKKDFYSDVYYSDF
jgi:hypothetical protein